MRAFDRVAAVVLALAGFLGGTLLAVEIGYRALGNSRHLLVPYEPVAAFVRGNAWSSAVVIAIAVGLIVVSVLLLIAELKPRRPGLLVLNSSHPDVTAAVPRKSVGRVVEAAATEVPGVDDASTKVRGRSVVLTARTPLTDPGNLQSLLTTRATAAVAALNLRRTPSVTVRVQKGSS